MFNMQDLAGQWRCQCGGTVNVHNDGCEWIAAQQRGVQNYQPSYGNALRNANTEAYRIEQAILAERERCAKVAEDCDDCSQHCNCLHIARKIRSGK